MSHGGERKPETEGVPHRSPSIGGSLAMGFERTLERTVGGTAPASWREPERHGFIPALRAVAGAWRSEYRRRRSFHSEYGDRCSTKHPKSHRDDLEIPDHCGRGSGGVPGPLRGVAVSGHGDRHRTTFGEHVEPSPGHHALLGADRVVDVPIPHGEKTSATRFSLGPQRSLAVVVSAAVRTVPVTLSIFSFPSRCRFCPS